MEHREDAMKVASIALLLLVVLAFVAISRRRAASETEPSARAAPAHA